LLAALFSVAGLLLWRMILRRRGVVRRAVRALEVMKQL
jgi:hypothetical protein